MCNSVLCLNYVSFHAMISLCLSLNESQNIVEISWLEMNCVFPIEIRYKKFQFGNLYIEMNSFYIEMNYPTIAYNTL